MIDKEDLFGFPNNWEQENKTPTFKETIAGFIITITALLALVSITIIIGIIIKIMKG